MRLQTLFQSKSKKLINLLINLSKISRKEEKDIPSRNLITCQLLNLTEYYSAAWGLAIATWKKEMSISMLTVEASLHHQIPQHQRFSDCHKNLLICQLLFLVNILIPSFWDVISQELMWFRSLSWEVRILPMLMVLSFLMFIVMTHIPTILQRCWSLQQDKEKSDSILIFTHVVKCVSVCWELGEVQLPRTGILKFQPFFNFSSQLKVSLWVKTFTSMSLDLKENKEHKKETERMRLIQILWDLVTWDMQWSLNWKILQEDSKKLSSVISI